MVPSKYENSKVLDHSDVDAMFDSLQKLRAVLEFRRRKGYRVAMAAVDSPPPAAVGEAEFARAAAAAAAVDSGGAPPP